MTLLRTGHGAADYMRRGTDRDRCRRLSSCSEMTVRRQEKRREISADRRRWCRMTRGVDCAASTELLQCRAVGLPRMC